MSRLTAVKRLLRDLRLVANPGSQNILELWYALKDVPLIRLNSKNYGYQLAKSLKPFLSSIPCPDKPGTVWLTSKPSTQSDIESPWFAYWCKQLKIEPIYHRKLWEFAFILQSMHENGVLKKGNEGVWFWCGQEPFASYFSSLWIHSLVTDLAPEKVSGLGWTETYQHATTIDSAYHADIVSRDIFDQHVSHRYVDMNSVPDFGKEFDFCWSICALEHLGSIEKWLEFVVNSCKTLKAWWMAIHTTEFNYLGYKSHETWHTVMFQEKHFLDLEKRLEKIGCTMFSPSFDVWNGVLDEFIDFPPYPTMKDGRNIDHDHPCHIKLALDGCASTCYGILIKKVR